MLEIPWMGGHLPGNPDMMPSWSTLRLLLKFHQVLFYFYVILAFSPFFAP